MCNGIWSCQMFVGEANGTSQQPNSVVTCEAMSDCTTACEPTTGECVDSAVSYGASADSCDGLNATTMRS